MRSQSRIEIRFPESDECGNGAVETVILKEAANDPPLSEWSPVKVSRVARAVGCLVTLLSFKWSSSDLRQRTVRPRPPPGGHIGGLRQALVGTLDGAFQFASTKTGSQESRDPSNPLDSVGLLGTASQYSHDPLVTDERSVALFRGCSRFWGSNLQNRIWLQLSTVEVASDQLTGYSYET